MRLATSPWMLATARDAQPARGGPVVTPTRLRGLGAALRRLADSVRAGPRAERLPAFDAATLRDLGLSHAASLAHGQDPHAARRRTSAEGGVSDAGARPTHAATPVAPRRPTAD